MAALAGRSEELATLRTCLDAVSDGRVQVAVIDGVAVIGKTWLLEETLRGAHTASYTVIDACAEELEAARPFGALARALEANVALAPEIARLVSEAASGDVVPGGSTFEIKDRLLDHLEQLATSGPLVLAVDDLLRADPATLQTAVGLLQRSAALPLGLLLALRPVPRSRSLDGVLEAVLSRAPTSIRLDPLDAEAVGALLAEAVAAEPGQTLRTQMRRAGGNPFLAPTVTSVGSSPGCGRPVSASARASPVSGRTPAGTASRRRSCGSSSWWRRACRTRRSASGCSSRAVPSRRTSRASSASCGCPPEPNSPPQRPDVTPTDAILTARRRYRWAGARLRGSSGHCLTWQLPPLHRERRPERLCHA
jgi:hypothetical protein